MERPIKDQSKNQLKATYGRKKAKDFLKRKATKEKTVTKVKSADRYKTLKAKKSKIVPK